MAMASKPVAGARGVENQAAALYLRRLSAGYWISQSLYAVAALGVADHLQDSPKSLRRLARVVGANPRALYRVMRALTGLGVFGESSPGYFSLCEAGKLLVRDAPGSLRALALWNGGITYRAWGDVVRSVQSGEPALPRVLGESLFQHLEGHPETAGVFHKAMAGLAAHTASAVVDACSFAESRVVVDVGGGSGALLATILQSDPRVRGAVFDAPSALRPAKKQLAEAGVLDRCDLLEGDFFEAVPRGGDTYILSSILHDWPDRDCLRILRNCRAAVPEGGRLLIVETVIMPDDEFCFTDLLDLQMLVVTGGRERTFDGYRRLLVRTGFRVSQTIRTRSAESVLEAFPVAL
jgi:hypothetical protein